MTRTQEPCFLLDLRFGSLPLSSTLYTQTASSSFTFVFFVSSILFEYLQNTAKQMIWEVDYRGEGRITQSDMVGVLLRVRQDQEGYEPDGLANLIEFCMYEREDTGSISVEDAMAILSRRYASSVVVSPEAIRRFCVEAHATLHKKIGLAELIRQAEYRKVMLSSNSMQA